jgi:hypothetical protein
VLRFCMSNNKAVVALGVSPVIHSYEDRVFYLNHNHHQGTKKLNV